MYYVTPHSPNPDCPSGEPCLTINEYAQGNHFDTSDNITLLFLNGEHNLTAQNLEINHKTSLDMVPMEAQQEVVININSQEAHIVIQNISVVTISDLKFSSQNASNDTTPHCLQFLDIKMLLVTGMSLDACQLSLVGEVQAAVNTLTASKSLVDTQNIYGIADSNSEVYFSVLE